MHHICFCVHTFIYIKYNKLFGKTQFIIKIPRRFYIYIKLQKIFKSLMICKTFIKSSTKSYDIL